MRKTLRPALIVFALLTLLTGVIYPAIIGAIGTLVFPGQARGSIVERDGRAVGSELLGQPFSAPGYFWSRPSAAGTHAYNGAASSGSNLGPMNPALLEAVAARIAALRAADPGNDAPVPVDLVTASGSGPRRTGTWPTGGTREGTRCGSHTWPDFRYLWRAPRERARTEPRTGRQPLKQRRDSPA